MNSSARSHVASSFTLIKGAMIDETYAVFAAWDFALSKRDNLDRLRRENFIGASTATWLRDVAKVLNRRFDPNARDRPLALLAKSGCPIDEWKPLLLWHITRDEFCSAIFCLIGSSLPLCRGPIPFGRRIFTRTSKASGRGVERPNMHGARQP